MQQARQRPVDLEKHFARFRRNIVGYDQAFRTPYGEQRILYADWTASGRLYEPIERRLAGSIGPFVGNTHSESSATGELMTQAYHRARDILKAHVGAGPADVILNAGFGMTSAINKLQRILGLRVHERWAQSIALAPEQRPVVFVTHLEHHSNHTTWYETIADVEVVRPTPGGTVDLEDLEGLLRKYRNRALKIGSFSACSNVTGVCTPVHTLARMMHEHGGICIVDYAASAPYVPIVMRPDDPREKLDAVVFSPHKFLGGPGSSGVLLFDSELYDLKSPDQPGGGTVLWTDPWGRFRYKNEIEEREDGGTPGFLQAIKGAMAVQLKEAMGTQLMAARESELRARMFAGLRSVPGLAILADNIEDRLAIFSFYFENIHYNLVVKLLNDRFGIQSRGGCSCAGTYGHYLLHVDEQESRRITQKIDHGDHSTKPGWVRVSLHPAMTDDEAEQIVDALRQISGKANQWQADYAYDARANEFRHRADTDELSRRMQTWFALEE